MATPSWQLQTPMDAIIFDCDGTLSTIEGIDELANYNHVYKAVQALTAEAMGATGINLDLYQKRLALVQPTAQQVAKLSQAYFEHQAPDVAAIIQLLKRLNKNIFLISAGLAPAVTAFGEKLEIPRNNIFAVDIQFDSAGNYLDFDRTSPLVTREGKRVIVNEIKTQHPNIIYIGDGMNDLAVIDIVRRFVGYGGAYFRENIAKLCEFYITTQSMTPLLPLCLTQDEIEKLLPEERVIYQKGLVDIENKLIIN